MFEQNIKNNMKQQQKTKKNGKSSRKTRYYFNTAFFLLDFDVDLTADTWDIVSFLLCFFQQNVQLRVLLCIGVCELEKGSQKKKKNGIKKSTILRASM